MKRILIGVAMLGLIAVYSVSPNHKTSTQTAITPVSLTDVLLRPYRKCMSELNQYHQRLSDDELQSENQECRKLIPVGMVP